MMIYVSRYSNKELQKDGYYPVCISVSRPRFKPGYELRGQCRTLAPRRDMLKLAYEPYREAYMQKLSEVGKDAVIREVRELEASAEAEGKALVLLCFEDIRIPQDWCHRTLFAEWWLENTGEVIEELPDPTPPKKV